MSSTVFNIPTENLKYALFLPILFGALVMYLSTPFWIKFGAAWQLLDLPKGRKAHAYPVPFTGGLAIGFTYYLSLLLVGGLRFPHFRTVLLGGLLTLTLGYLDDRYDLASGLKLLWQTVIALVTAGLGVRIYFLTNPFGNMVTLGWIGYPLTVLWLLATMNMINLIDGLDGLAVGISLIASVSLMIIGFGLRQIPAALLSALLIGVLAGILPYNFYPARIFIGNSGAYFLGYIIGVISVLGALKLPTVLAFAVPVFALGVPVLDTLWAIWRRWRQKKPLAVADRGHIHYLLVHSGAEERQVVLILYGISLLLGVSSIFLSRVELFFGAIILLLGLGAVFFTFYGLGLLQTAVKQRTATAGEAQTNEGKELSHE
ncbi:MAG TPA: undecaprenyl/decaprenyl-phosphate alpha-N-acetylglucosaminyl 1-phosphate transferase [Firmicutes bacterium]|nr:undecaprenyl/decaprenyl-phosphate alpha-N-acetylglucosaminyl 1-phosphate transferase [Bacillota bacterium]